MTNSLTHNKVNKIIFIFQIHDFNQNEMFNEMTVWNFSRACYSLVSFDSINSFPSQSQFQVLRFNLLRMPFLSAFYVFISHSSIGIKLLVMPNAAAVPATFNWNRIGGSKIWYHHFSIPASSFSLLAFNAFFSGKINWDNSQQFMLQWNLFNVISLEFAQHDSALDVILVKVYFVKSI